MLTKRTIVAVAMTLMMFLFAPAARPAGDDGPGTKPSDTAKPDGSTKPAAASDKTASKDNNSPVEAELQQLRDVLAAQQATLQAQQQRISDLESQLHAAPAQPAASATASTAAIATGSASGSVSIPPAATAIQPSGAQPVGTPQAGDQPRSPLSFKIGSADFTPGGWADLEGIFRSADIGSGPGTTFTGIPYNNSLPLAGLSEFRFTAQTSRISLKVEAPISDSTKAIAYIESDFNGYQPPNLLETTNSNTFRMRLYWADIRHGNWEVLAGQSWSLITPNRVGLSPLPGDMFVTNNLDTNYNVGLVFNRQAGFRLVYHPTNWWALGVSLEDPQQYVPTSVVFPNSSFAGQFDNGSGSTSGAGATTNTTTPNLHPDVILKTALDWKVGGHAWHVEGGGLIRSFKVFNNIVTPNDTSAITGASGTFNANLELFNHFHAIFNSFYGAGGGRYLGGNGPDVIVKSDGTLSPIHSGSGLAGFEYQATPTFMFDAYYSGAYFARNVSLLASTATPTPSCEGVAGFTCVGYGFSGSANSNNRTIQEATIGFNKTFWSSPNFGKLQFITQSSYAIRDPWVVATAAPKNAHDFIQYIDLRYVLP
jgi:hypothetical protein